MVNAVIAIHGGAGAITRSAMSAEKEQLYRQALHDIVTQGQQILAQGGSALDAVTEAVRLLEEAQQARRLLVTVRMETASAMHRTSTWTNSALW